MFSWKRVAKWIIATVLSAFIGAGAVWYLDRAKPSATIASVSVDSSADKRFDDAIIPIDDSASVAKGLVDSDWVTPIRRSSMLLSELRKLLERNKNRLEHHTQELERLQRDLPKMTALLTTAESKRVIAEQFIDLWEPNDGLIYGSVRGHFARGAFTLPGDKSYNGDPFLHISPTVIPDRELTALAVNKKGSKFVSMLVPTDKAEVKLSEYAGNALAHFDQGELNRMLDVVKKEIRNKHLHDTLKVEVGRYLLSLSRWSVIVVVTNSGSRSMSVSPYGKLLIDTDGTKIKKPFVEIEMQHRDADGRPVPVNVPGGESRSILFTSHRLIRDIAQWVQLHSMYNDASRKCLLLLAHLPRTVFGNTTIATRPETFGRQTHLDELTTDQKKVYFQ